MESTEITTDVLLDELIDVFYHKLIYYVPSEILTEEVFSHIKGTRENDLFDEFYCIDNNSGSSSFTKFDALEINGFLMDKRSFLQENTFKLLEKRKELTEFEFIVVIAKYHEFLNLFIYLTEWFRLNLNKYNGDSVDLGVVSAFNMQQNYFEIHLSDVRNYFGVFIDLEKKHDFSTQTFVSKYLLELMTRYVNIINKTEEQREEIATEIVAEKIEIEPIVVVPVKKKRQYPQLDDEQVETIIMERVFNVKKDEITL